MYREISGNPRWCIGKFREISGADNIGKFREILGNFGKVFRFLEVFSPLSIFFVSDYDFSKYMVITPDFLGPFE